MTLCANGTEQCIGVIDGLLKIIGCGQYLCCVFVRLFVSKHIVIILFFGPCIFIIEGRTDQRNAQINFSLINLLLFKLLRHVSAT